MTVVSERIAGAINIFGATQAEVFDICHVISGYILFVLSNKYPQGVLVGKFLQENPINTGVH